MESKFEPARSALDLLHIGINTVSKGKHVPEIDGINRITKERVHFTYNEIN